MRLVETIIFMDKPQKLIGLIAWLGLIVIMINTIWLILITLSQGNTLFKMSTKSVLLIVFLLSTGTAILLFRTKWVKLIFEKHSLAIKKLLSILAFSILILSVFFVLMPFASFRLQVSYAIWLRMLPVVLTYTALSILWFWYMWLELPTQPIVQSAPSKREIFIDFARGFAIILAVATHIFSVFEYDVLFGKSMYQVISLTRLATPSFILITGIMFELVYFRKAEEQSFMVAAQRLVKRSLQCYGIYVVTVLIEWFNQKLNLVSAQYAITFLGSSLLSEVLKFYALFLLLAIPIIWLRKRFGIWLIAFLPIVVWLGDLLLDRMTWPAANQRIGNFTGLLFGHPFGSYFSVWHSLTFMAFGMLLGYMLKRSKQAGNWKNFQVTLLLLTLICLGVSLISVLPTTWEEFFFNFSYRYRKNHEIPYYSIGSMGAFLLLWISWRLRMFLNHPWLKHTITSLGKNSLWAFAVGNSLAALLPTQNNQAWYVVLFLLMVFAGSVGMIKMKDLLRSQTRLPVRDVKYMTHEAS